MDFILVQSSLLAWVAGLVVGLPLVIILLGELAARLERHDNPLAQVVRLLRHIVGPLLAIYLLVWQVLGISRTEPSVRVLATLLWGTFTIVGLIFISNVIRLGKRYPRLWIPRLPRAPFCRGTDVDTFQRNLLYSHLRLEYGHQQPARCRRGRLASCSPGATRHIEQPRLWFLTRSGPSL